MHGKKMFFVFNMFEVIFFCFLKVGGFMYLVVIKSGI